MISHNCHRISFRLSVLEPELSAACPQLSFIREYDKFLLLHPGFEPREEREKKGMTSSRLCLCFSSTRTTRTQPNELSSSIARRRILGVIFLPKQQMALTD